MRDVAEVAGLNCLSAGSVSLTARGRRGGMERAGRLNCLSAGSVSLTPHGGEIPKRNALSQLPFGWVCFSNDHSALAAVTPSSARLNCLSAGSVSLTCKSCH